MRINGLAFIHYPVTDKQRARGFYEGVLGLKAESSMDFPDGFWIEYAVGSATLALSNFWQPASTPNGPTAAMEVEDFDQAVTELKAAGAKLTMDPYESPVCFQAIALDPDGNSIFIHKRKPGRG
jgi:predicted enzyme related to lactoylglutathione lyase